MKMKPHLVGETVQMDVQKHVDSHVQLRVVEIVQVTVVALVLVLVMEAVHKNVQIHVMEIALVRAKMLAIPHAIIPVLVVVPTLVQQHRDS